MWRTNVKLLLILAAAFAVGAASAQSLLSTAYPAPARRLLPSDSSVLDLQAPKRDLPCSVVMLKPRLGFNLMFGTGYLVRVPMEALTGKENLLTILFRVTAEARRDQPVYFHQEFRVPLIKDDQDGEAKLEGAYLIGQGKYHIDWLMRDREDRFCAGFWNLEAELRGKEAVLSKLVAKNVVTSAQADPFAADVSPRMKTPGRSINVRIVVNFDPRDPTSAILKRDDLEGLSAVLRTISRDPRIGRYSVVACSLYTRRVIYRQDGAHSIDLPHVGKSLVDLRLGRISIDQLAMTDREGEFIAELIKGDAANEHPEAIILISSASDIELKLPREAVSQLRGSRVFYLCYDVRGDPFDCGPFGRVVNQLRGSAYTVREPRDLLIAWSKIMEQLTGSE
jgi:hypothetical protein